MPELSKTVTDAGGYRALAAQHVKSPRRRKQPNNQAASDASDASSDDNGEDQSKDEDETEHITRDDQQKYPVVKTLKGTEVLHCKFDGSGRDMTSSKLATGLAFVVASSVWSTVDQSSNFFAYTLFE